MSEKIEPLTAEEQKELAEESEWQLSWGADPLDIKEYCRNMLRWYATVQALQARVVEWRAYHSWWAKRIAEAKARADSWMEERIAAAEARADMWRDGWEADND